MTTTPQPTVTPKQLMLLAKMLPDDLHEFGYKLLRKHRHPTTGELLVGQEVKPTELLDLCWRVEEGLYPIERVAYEKELKRAVRNPYDFWMLHAIPSQRITALAKVKGLI